MNNFTDYETAKKLKELGFKELCYGFFASHEGKEYVLDSIKTSNEGQAVSAPLWQQAKNWLWRNHNIHIAIIRDGKEFRTGEGINYQSPIEAEIGGIKKAVELLYANVKYDSSFDRKEK